MKLDYSNIEAIILKVFVNKASDEELKTLERWLALSKENQESFISMKNIWDITHPPFESADIDTEHALNKVLSKIQRKVKLSFLNYYQRIASIILLPLAIVFGYYYFSSPQSESESASYEVFSQYGTRSNISLPDGSKVCLNAASSIVYPNRFKKDDRQVKLSGEAYFDVKSSIKKPFSVLTKNLKMTATGTSFNINSYESDSLCNVVLDHGTLSISIDNKEAISLSAGEIFCYNKQTNQYAIIPISSDKQTIWRKGILMFRDDPLEYVFKRLEQMYNVKFIIRDNAMKQYKYRATFQNESLDEILSLLRLSAPIDFAKDTSTDEKHSMKRRQIEVFSIE